MQKTARQQEILRILQDCQCSSVREISQTIFASPATVRRDLHVLEGEGLVRTFYGGVMLACEENREVPLSIREHEDKAAKMRIARTAAKMLPPRASVIIDASSTAMCMAQWLDADADLTVFTNCLRTAVALCEHRIRTYCIGGQVSQNGLVTTGSLAEQNLMTLNADYCFFSSQGLGFGGDITDNSEEETQIRRLMLTRARHCYFMCNSAKVGRKMLFSVCDASKLDGVISDADLSEIANVHAIRADA